MLKLFPEITDPAERAYIVGYYRYILGWQLDIPKSSLLPSVKTRLRVLARSRSRQQRGPAHLLTIH